MQPGTEYSRLSAHVVGRVQGVGFRIWARRQALALGLRGWVRNRPNDSVEVVAEGPRFLLEQLLEALHRGPPGAQVRTVEVAWDAADGTLTDFRIVH
jgi:acylphosphatase